MTKCRICQKYLAKPKKMEPREEVVAALAKLKGVQPPGGELLHEFAVHHMGTYHHPNGFTFVNTLGEDVTVTIRRTK